jgi:hypothetical protein
MKIDMTFTAEIERESFSSWTCVVWPESVENLGTGKAVKVSASINGHDFQATFLPVGGKHMLPLRAAVLKAIDKQVGDKIEVRVTDRL